MARMRFREEGVDETRLRSGACGFGRFGMARMRSREKGVYEIGRLRFREVRDGQDAIQGGRR